MHRFFSLFLFFAYYLNFGKRNSDVQISGLEEISASTNFVSDVSNKLPKNAQ